MGQTGHEGAVAGIFSRLHEKTLQLWSGCVALWLLQCVTASGCDCQLTDLHEPQAEGPAMTP